MLAFFTHAFNGEIGLSHGAIVKSNINMLEYFFFCFLHAGTQSKSVAISRKL